jgi:hypothetical protein
MSHSLLVKGALAPLAPIVPFGVPVVNSHRRIGCASHATIER